MIEELDRHIGVLAEGWIADCSIDPIPKITIGEESCSITPSTFLVWISMPRRFVAGSRLKKAPSPAAGSSQQSKAIFWTSILAFVIS
jgi:hypothetical protein